jgi:ribonuclease HII
MKGNAQLKKTAARVPKFLIGIDEVGRGPIAGPVAVGAFIFLKPGDAKAAAARSRIFRSVRESKQLSEAKREEWFAKILEAQAAGLIDFSVTFVSEKVIDSKGLSFSIRSALEKSLATVAIHAHADITAGALRCCVLLDGGLRAPAIFTDQETIIKGDVKEQVIALASICAKVLRDRRMRVHAKKYPAYDFDVHKGYGTKAHYAAIRQSGLTPLHRRSFLKKLL